MNIIIPYGLSLHKERPISKTKRTLFLRIPIFIYHAKKYDIASDNFITGWWKFNILVSFDNFYGGIGVRIMYGWSL
jgi:hypothetical protein